MKNHSYKELVADFDLTNIAQQRYQELHGDILPVKSFVVHDKTSLYDSVMPALLEYRRLYLHLLVPLKFVVPNNSDVWPECAWGLRLGLIVSKIRKGVYYKSRRIELENMGFDYSPRNTSKYRTLKVALLRYKELHGDMLVPSKFKVPDESTVWPASVLGFRLGKCVSGIRGGDIYASRRDELESIGFDYTCSNDRSYQSLKVALLRYKELHGDMLVPRGFKVPDESTVWPASVLGLRLGKSVSHIRAGNSYVSRRDELESMGFDYRSQQPQKLKM